MFKARFTTMSGLAAAALLALASPSAPATAQQKFVTIGTGGVTGVYYAVGGAVCRRQRPRAVSARRGRGSGRPSGRR